MTFRVLKFLVRLAFALLKSPLFKALLLHHLSHTFSDGIDFFALAELLLSLMGLSITSELHILSLTLKNATVIRLMGIVKATQHALILMGPRLIESRIAFFALIELLVGVEESIGLRLLFLLVIFDAFHKFEALEEFKRVFKGPFEYVVSLCDSLAPSA